jgi:ribosomal protein S18 acetylase RimI-like enzyme
MSGGLWRLTRNRYGRRLYETLDAAGLTASLMVEYRRPAADPPAPDAAGVGFETRDPGDLDESFRDAKNLPETDLVVCATRDGERVGSLLLTLGSVHVDVLDREFDPRGVYVWRVWVEPDHRGQGIGTGLVAAGVAAAADHADAASALVARDNVPSKRAFESVGFRPTRELWYLGVGPLSYRRERPR